MIEDRNVQTAPAASRALQSGAAPAGDTSITPEQERILEEAGELAATNFIQGSPDPTITNFMSEIAPGYTPQPGAADAFVDPNARMTRALTPEQRLTADEIRLSRGLARELPGQMMRGDVQETRALMAEAGLAEAEAELAELKDRRKRPAARRPGVERLLGEFQKAVDEPEEGSQLALIRERQDDLRFEIFMNQENYENAVNGLGEFKYDPYKAFPTSGAKAAALIGIALGGIGAALKGGENQVFNYFNDVVNRELERQKLEANNLAQQAGAFQNLYTMNRELLGDEQAAEKLTLSQIAKSYQLQIEAHIADIGDINQQKLAQQKADAALSKFLLEDAARREDQAKLTDADIKRADTRKKAADAARGTSGELKDSLRNLDLIMSNMKSLDDSEDDEGEKGFFRRALEVAAMDLAQGDNTALKVLFEQTFSSEGEFAAYADFASRLRPIAFGLAREGQSASSISNRDVAMFLSILADPVRNIKSVKASLEFMQKKLERDSIIQNAAARNPRLPVYAVEDRLIESGKIEPVMDLADYLERKDAQFKGLSQKLRTKFAPVGQ